MNLDHLLGDKGRKRKPLETFNCSLWDAEFELYPAKYWKQSQIMRDSHDRQELYADLVETAGTEATEKIMSGGTFAEVFESSQEGKATCMAVTDRMIYHYRNSIETALNMRREYLKDYGHDDYFIRNLKATIDRLLSEAATAEAAEGKGEAKDEETPKRRSTKRSKPAAV